MIAYCITNGDSVTDPFEGMPTLVLYKHRSTAENIMQQLPKGVASNARLRRVSIVDTNDLDANVALRNVDVAMLQPCEHCGKPPHPEL